MCQWFVVPKGERPAVSYRKRHDVLFARHPWGGRSTAAGEAVVVLARRWNTDAKRLAVMDSLATGMLDALPELARGELLFLPLADKGLVAPTISVVIDARRSLSRAARRISEFLVSRTQERLADSRAKRISATDS